MYQQWWKIISIWLTVLEIKSPAITWSVLWRAGWPLTHWGQLWWIDDWNIQFRKRMYHCWWQIISLLVTSLANKVPAKMRSRSLPTLIVPCSTFVATTSTLWMWYDECNMSLWWCCVPVVSFVDGYQKVRAKFLAQRLQSCLSLRTRNKNWLRTFCLNIILIRI